jgi:hypothetical protein
MSSVTELNLENHKSVFNLSAMQGAVKYPFADQGRRLRWLRLAECIPTQVAFAQRLGWTQSAVAQFERGSRQVPGQKALQLRQQFPGFDPIWLWTGDKRGLAFDLRQRIDAEEAKETPAKSARDKR